MSGQENEAPEHELARLRRADVMASIERSRATYADAVSQRDAAPRLRRDFRELVTRVRLLPEKVYQITHPHIPWLSHGAVRYLDQHLDRRGVGFEFGSGNSTAWLAQRLGILTSVEHDPEWYARVRGRLADFPNAHVALRSLEGDECSPYVAEALKVVNRSLSFALVDGVLREPCVVALLPKMAPGGLFAVDDTLWPGYSTFLLKTVPWERVHQSQSPGKQTTIWVAP